MTFHHSTAARRSLRILQCFSLVLLASPSIGSAESPTFDVVRVDESWVLEVAIPDAGTNAPQVCSVVAPTGDIDFGYAEFNINHHSQPAYRPGGLQLQVWSGGLPIIVNNDPDGGMLSSPNETMTWTQSMSIDDGVLTFSVHQGQSATWGNFGQDGRLTIRVAAPLTNLNGYDPAVSIGNSGAGFAANRVRSLKITSIRYYAADGRVVVDDSPRTVIGHE